MSIFNELLETLHLNQLTNVEAWFLALGDKATMVEMDVPIHWNEGGTSVGKGGNKVWMRPLDSFDLENISLIKLDVEGAEDYVLEGGRLTIARNKLLNDLST